MQKKSDNYISKISLFILSVSLLTFNMPIHAQTKSRTARVTLIVLASQSNTDFQVERSSKSVVVVDRY
jgi:hypothetical protein